VIAVPVHLDTRDLDPGSRIDAFRSALNVATMPTSVEVTPDVEARLAGFEVGHGVNAVTLSLRAAELRVERTARHVRDADPERLSVAFNSAGSCVTTNHGRQETRNQVLRLTDLTAAYGIAWQGACQVIALEVDTGDLGLSVDDVRAMLPHVAQSPLQPFLQRHLADVVESSKMVDSLIREDLAEATKPLIRGLLTAVSPRDRDRREAVAQTLPTRIDHFVRMHLGEFDLTPARIAGAHHISLRHLYVLMAQRGLAPAEWIMQLRLERARHILVQPGTTVKATARTCGFKDPSHFARRFKDAYGITPRQFVAQGASAASDASRPAV